MGKAKESTTTTTTTEKEDQKKHEQLEVHIISTSRMQTSRIRLR